MIRNVVGYEGRYVVDDDGNVFSVRSNRYLASIKMESGSEHEYKKLRSVRTGGEVGMKMPLFERIRMWWYRWIIRHICHHTYDCCKDILKDCRTCPGRGWGGID